jgi:hypothetical protein
MKKSVLAAAAAVFAFTGTASAADMDYDRQVGLIVSGVVDKWAGVQFIDDGVRDDTVFANGGEGKLSLPLGNNWSAQSDVKYEYNSNALEAPINNDVFGARYSFQGAAHFSYRDPSSFLFGAFGGIGEANTGPFGSTNHSFVGGEAQVYLNNITLYAQGGYVDFDFEPNPARGLDDGVFVRGVFRWFMANDSRIQLEGTYLNAEYGTGDDFEAFSVGARYDFDLNVPLFGATPLYVGYRGTFRDNCLQENNWDDHTIMVGTSYSFSGDRMTIDRQGATLDTPDFNHGCAILQ